jgi:hypothetical protein
MYEFVSALETDEYRINTAPYWNEEEREFISDLLFDYSHSPQRLFRNQWSNIIDPII